MGYANSDLIVPAILLYNPGVTREELSELFFKVNSFEGEFDYRARWDLKGIHSAFEKRMRKEDLRFPSTIQHHPGHIANEKFHTRLFCVADFLNLNHSEEFKQALEKEKHTDEFGFRFGLNRLNPMAVIDGDWKEPAFEVEFKMPSELTDIIVKENFFDERIFEQGKSYKNLGRFQGRIEKYFTKGKKNFLEKQHTFHAMNIRIIEVPKEYIVVHSLQELITEYPLFNPETMFDWTPESGFLYPDYNERNGPKPFRWKREGIKYYLDVDYMKDHISGIFTENYSGLVLTAEAVKNNAWKLLSYRGLKHLDNFFKKFPDSKPLYEQAVWDMQTSFYAKRQKMTNSELMRMRLSGF